MIYTNAQFAAFEGLRMLVDNESSFNAILTYLDLWAKLDGKETVKSTLHKYGWGEFAAFVKDRGE